MSDVLYLGFFSLFLLGKSWTKPSFATGILGGGGGPKWAQVIPNKKMKLDKLDSSGMGLLIFLQWSKGLDALICQEQSQKYQKCEGPKSYAFWIVPFLALIHVQAWNAVTYTIANGWKGWAWVWGNHWVGVEDGGSLQQKHTWQYRILKCFVASSSTVFQMSNDRSLECLFYTDRTIGLPHHMGMLMCHYKGPVSTNQSFRDPMAVKPQQRWALRIESSCRVPFFMPSQREIWPN